MAIEKQEYFRIVENYKSTWMVREIQYWYRGNFTIGQECSLIAR